MYSVDPKVYEAHRKTGGDSKKLKQVRDAQTEQEFPLTFTVVLFYLT